MEPRNVQRSWNISAKNHLHSCKVPLNIQVWNLAASQKLLNQHVSSSFNSWNRLSIKHHSHFKTTSSQGSLKLIWTSLFLKPIFTPNRSRLTVLTVFQMQKHVYHEASRWLLFGYGWAKSHSQRGGGESKSVAIWGLGVVEDAQVWWLHHLLSALVGRSIG